MLDYQLHFIKSYQCNEINEDGFNKSFLINEINSSPREKVILQSKYLIIRILKCGLSK